MKYVIIGIAIIIVVFLFLPSGTNNEETKSSVETMSDNDKVRVIMQRIQNDPNWYGLIKAKASVQGISVSKALYNNALYIYQTEGDSAVYS